MVVLLTSVVHVFARIIAQQFAIHTNTVTGSSVVPSLTASSVLRLSAFFSGMCKQPSSETLRTSVILVLSAQSIDKEVVYAPTCLTFMDGSNLYKFSPKCLTTSGHFTD